MRQHSREARTGSSPEDQRHAGGSSDCPSSSAQPQVMTHRIMSKYKWLLFSSNPLGARLFSRLDNIVPLEHNFLGLIFYLLLLVFLLLFSVNFLPLTLFLNLFLSKWNKQLGVLMLGRMGHKMEIQKLSGSQQLSVSAFICESANERGPWAVGKPFFFMPTAWIRGVVVVACLLFTSIRPS